MDNMNASTVTFNVSYVTDNRPKITMTWVPTTTSQQIRGISIAGIVMASLLTGIIIVIVVVVVRCTIRRRNNIKNGVKDTGSPVSETKINFNKKLLKTFAVIQPNFDKSSEAPEDGYESSETDFETENATEEVDSDILNVNDNITYGFNITYKNFMKMTEDGYLNNSDISNLQTNVKNSYALFNGDKRHMHNFLQISETNDNKGSKTVSKLAKTAKVQPYIVTLTRAPSKSILKAVNSDQGDHLPRKNKHVSIVDDNKIARPPRMNPLKLVCNENSASDFTSESDSDDTTENLTEISTNSNLDLTKNLRCSGISQRNSLKTNISKTKESIKFCEENEQNLHKDKETRQSLEARDNETIKKLTFTQKSKRIAPIKKTRSNIMTDITTDNAEVKSDGLRNRIVNGSDSNSRDISKTIDLCPEEHTYEEIKYISHVNEGFVPDRIKPISVS